MRKSNPSAAPESVVPCASPRHADLHHTSGAVVNSCGPEKPCPHCGRDLPYSSFWRLKHSKTGRASWCKGCIRARHPERYLGRVRLRLCEERGGVGAYRIVQRAVAGGRLRAPGACSHCGIPNVRLHAHHDDYSRPLDVRWLCSKCHVAEHQYNTDGPDPERRAPLERDYCPICGSPHLNLKTECGDPSNPIPETPGRAEPEMRPEMIPDPEREPPEQFPMEVLDSLTYREREVMKLRWGLGKDGYTYTLKEVARRFKMTREGIRQIQVRASRKLRELMKPETE